MLSARTARGKGSLRGPGTSSSEERFPVLHGRKSASVVNNSKLALGHLPYEKPPRVL